MPRITLSPTRPTYSLYSAESAEQLRATLQELPLDELRALLPGMVATGGDGLKLLRAELLRRAEPGQVYPPACPKCLQRPQQCVC